MKPINRQQPKGLKCSCCSHQAHSVLAPSFLHINKRKTIRSFDPTQTRLLRDRYVAQMRKRFKLIRKAIFDFVVEEDCFGLTDAPKILEWTDEAREASIEARKAKAKGEENKHAFRERQKKDFEKPSQDLINRASNIFKSFEEGSILAKAVDNQMRGGVLHPSGKFTEFTTKMKQANLNKIAREINLLKEKDPEAFEAARQWDLAQRLGFENYNEIPEQIPVYRGHDLQEKSGKVLNVTYKEEIANEFGETGVVTSYTISKSDILFSLSNSVFDEGELIVFSKDLKKEKEKLSETAQETQVISKLKPGQILHFKEGGQGILISVGFGNTLIVKLPDGSINYAFDFKKIRTNSLIKLNRRDFAFRTSSDKVTGFMDWLMKQEDDKILEITYSPGKSTVSRRPWEKMYIQSAYKKGMERSEKELRKMGVKITPFPNTPIFSVDAMFNLPIHADRIGLLYTRSFNELKGITDVMDQKISRSLAQGMAEGRGPREIARDLIKEVDISQRRAETLARTEIIYAHAEATLNTYEAVGVHKVTVEAEWSAAQDDKVCPLCIPLDEKIFDLKEARGMIPRHPNCRCAWLPVVNFDK